MGKNETQVEIPKELAIEKQLITCPACGETIEVDMKIDITPITALIGALGGMPDGKAGEDEKEDNAGN